MEQLEQEQHSHKEEQLMDHLARVGMQFNLLVGVIQAALVEAVASMEVVMERIMLVLEEGLVI